MAVNIIKYKEIKAELDRKQVTLIAVSKTKPVEDIQALYDLGHRDFGENYVQELTEKYAALPKDIRWHFIGHLQSNKVKFIAPFVHLIHGVDSENLLKEINKQGAKNNRIIDCLLQIYIAKEETKFGFDESEIEQLTGLADFNNICIRGFMGMASFTEDNLMIQKEFAGLKKLFDQFKTTQSTNINLQTISMGMSSDYHIAVAEGSTMVRIGSLLFGERIYNK